jgi:hypothetical protein
VQIAKDKDIANDGFMSDEQYVTFTKGWLAPALATTHQEEQYLHLQLRQDDLRPKASLCGSGYESSPAHHLGEG